MSQTQPTVPTVTRNHYMLTLRLDLADINPAQFQAWAQRLQSRGITVATLAQEQTRTPDAVSLAYQCHNVCRRQQPPVELRQQPIPLPTWHTAFVDGPTAAPHLYFLAIQNGEYIGVCLFETIPQASGKLVSGFTGVLPDHAGQGIAKALKACCLLHVKSQGFPQIETQNLVINRGMCAINRALGFQTVRRHRHTYPIPVTL